MQTHIADTAVLSRSRPLFLFAFPTMLMQSRGRYIGGYRHVNFCHSYHPWAAPIKKSLAPPLGRYDYLSALSFQLKQKNYGYFCCASFPLCGAGAFCCRFFGKVPEVRRCRSPPPFDSPVKRDIPIPKCLVDCLREAKANSISEYVIADSEGQPLS